MRVFNNLLKDVNIFKKEKERKGKKEKEKRSVNFILKDWCANM